jgi:HAD superfamily hydrolase (TIGR01490 family)
MSATAAIFDVDGTLVRGSSERLFFRYLWRRGQLAPIRIVQFLGRLARRPGTRFQDKSYLFGLDVAALVHLGRRCYREVIAPRLSPEGVAAVREHQARGDAIIILTGSLALLAEPLREDLGAHWLLATELAAEGGRCTGEIRGLHPRGENKRRLLLELAARRSLDLERASAYGDDLEDLPLLRSVGRPVVVNPSRRLGRLARGYGWAAVSF